MQTDKWIGAIIVIDFFPSTLTCLEQYINLSHPLPATEGGEVGFDESPRNDNDNASQDKATKNVTGEVDAGGDSRQADDNRRG